MSYDLYRAVQNPATGVDSLFLLRPKSEYLIFAAQDANLRVLYRLLLNMEENKFLYIFIDNIKIKDSLNAFLLIHVFANAKNGFLFESNNILLDLGSKLVFFVFKSIANKKTIQKETCRP